MTFQTPGLRVRGSRASARKAPRVDADPEGRARELMLMAAHDLRSPLAAIKLITQMIGKPRLIEPSSAEWAEAVSKISRVTDSAFDIIDDLLAVERLRKNRGAGIARALVDVEGIAREAISLHAEALRHTRCEVTLIRHEDLDSALGPWDRGLLLRIFSNLLRNVTRHARGAPVRVTLGRRGAHLRIVFADSGPGLPPGAAESLHAADRTTRGGPSHGLGIWIVRRAVEGLHGTLAIHNSPGHGVAFDIELPHLAKGLPTARSLATQEHDPKAVERPVR